MEDYLTDKRASEIIPGRFCGLNADWCVSAWQLTDGPLNQVDGAYFILDHEDGSAALTRRYYNEETGGGLIVDLVVDEWSEAGVSALVARYILMTNKVGA